MVPELERLKDGIAALCRAHGVVKLDLFGSAARGTDFDPERCDFDFLVEFEREGSVRDFLRFRYYLEALAGRRVDLTEGSAIRNPYLRASVDVDRREVFHGNWPERSAARCADRRETMASFIHGRSQDQFLNDVMLRSAVERQCEILGEAFSRLGRIAPDKAAEIPEWREAIDFRNLLSHGYDVVKPSRVWATVTCDIPVLADRLRTILAAVPRSGGELQP